MNLRILTTSAALGGVLLFAAALPLTEDAATRSSAHGAAASPVQDPDQDDETQLGEYMKGVNGCLKALKAGLAAEDADAPAKVLELIGKTRELQVLLTNSRNEEPERVAEVDASERAEWLKSYRLAIIETHRLAIDLEVALLEGDLEAARELRKDLYGTKRQGHRQFK